MIFLVHTPHLWRGIRQRPHHLMTRFARSGHFVRWAESRYLRWLTQRPRDFYRSRAENPQPNLEVRPVTLINGERFGFIRAHNKFWLAQALRRNIPATAEGARILWLYNPHEAHLAEHIPHDLLIYDIMDEYQGFPWSPPGIAEEEQQLLARADWVFAGTQALFESKGKLAAGKIECILSGVETEHFSHRRQAAPDPTCEALRSRHRKLIGYAGMIDLRLDQDLLIHAARRFSDWGFVLVGPVATDVTALKAQPNIYFLGQQPYEALPSLYHTWDAAMLPFVENELTRSINPTKMLEYAAANLPILARALPDVRMFYADGAWIYQTERDFTWQLDAIDNATPLELEMKLAIARAWARERSWDALAQRMLDRVESLLAARAAR